MNPGANYVGMGSTLSGNDNQSTYKSQPIEKRTKYWANQVIDHTGGAVRDPSEHV
jgi:hypothetical protein